MYINESLKRYIDDLAAKLPAPGGGSAAALSGVLGIALLEMVCNFTIGKEKYKSVEQDVQAYLNSLKKIREEFSTLIDGDVKTYTSICSAYKSKDKKLIDKALKNGYDISLKMCKLSKNAVEIAKELAKKGNPNLITDVGCGTELLDAAFNSAIINAKINLKGIEDKDFASKENKAIETLKKEWSGDGCEIIGW